MEWDGRNVIDISKDPTVVYNSNNPNVSLWYLQERIRPLLALGSTWLNNQPEHAQFSFSPTLTEGLYFAKIMHSLLAVDLGNRNAPNLLLRDQDIRYALDPPDNMNRNSTKGILYTTLPASFQNYALITWPGIPPAGEESRVPLNKSYDLFKQRMGSLGTNNATIFTQYLCSVLEQKSTGTMLLAMVIADLVFLQAAWKILKLVADTILQRQDPAAMAYDRRLIGASGPMPMGEYNLSNTRIEEQNTINDSDADTRSLIAK